LSNAIAASGQAAGTTTADVRGVVKDEAGAALSGIIVDALNPQTGLKRSDKTNDEGSYTLRFLPPGTYRIIASAQGFQVTTIDNVQLNVGASVKIDLKLKVSTINESVVVWAEQPLIDGMSTEGSKIIDNKRIQNLPINLRNFLSFAVTAPGVVIDRGPQSGGAPTSGLSINGQNPRYNNILVDGLDNNDPAVGSVRSSFPQEAVQEYQVIRSPFAAEYGRTVGGVINIVTQSGSNDLHGSGFYFFRNENLSARNGLSISKTPFKQQQVGGSMGAALKRDHIFFFGAVEKLSVSDANIVTISDQAVAVIRANGFDIMNGVVPFDRQLSTGLVKIDFIPNAKNSLSLRGTFTKEQNENQQLFGGQVAKSAGGVLHARDRSLAANWISIVSPNVSNEFRALFSPRINNLDSHDPTGGVSIIIQGVARFGMRQTLPQSRHTRQYQIFDALTYTRGRFTYKVGFDYTHLDLRGSLPSFINGQYQFSAQTNGVTALQAFASGIPSLFIQAFGESYKEVVANNLGSFAEVKWNVTPRFLLHLGTRYELENPVDPFPTVSDNWAPRFSFSWLPTDKFRVRGGAGRFYGVSSSWVLFAVGISNGVNVRTITRTSRGGLPPSAPWLLPNHRFANEQQAGISSAPQSIFEPGDFSTAYSDLASLAVEREFLNQLVLSVEYAGARGRKILISRDINPIIPPTGRPNLAFANIYSYESNGNSWYSSLTVGAQTRSSNTFQISAFYTYAKADDDYIDWRTEFQPQDPFNLKDERGPSVHTPKHRLTFTGIYSTREAQGAWWRQGWTAATIVEFNARRPFNQLAGFDRNRNGDALSDRPDGVRRNQGNLRNLFNVDLRFSRRLSSEYLKIDAILDVFNLLNRRNVLEVQNVANQPGFGSQPLRLADPRRIQLGMRFQF
jgi:hypothetical protein